MKPGFESFLRPRRFAQLQVAAEGGPIIIITIDKEGSYALIVYRRRRPSLVRLPRATPAAVQGLADRLGPRPASLRDEEVVAILREIWGIIIGPIVWWLRFPWFGRLPLRSRIWWCPTGIASRLPLHAAGPYTEGKANLPEIFTSSYTPTLGALIRAREAWSSSRASAAPSAPSLTVIGQPNTPNQIALPKVKDEIIAINTRAPNANVLEGDIATRQSVIDSIAAHNWVHLACHGHHNPEDPFLSHFSMHDGDLTLRDILQKNLPQAQFAFLSACHSAKVSETLPDEALHPAAGMMFAGYQSVIGTMWAFDDGVGAKLADEFYRLMLGGKSGPKDCSKAAEALQRALYSLGDTISLSQRINVVHFGI